MEVPYPLAFALNWVVEALALVIVFRREPLRTLAATTFANGVTHPLVWFVVPTIDADWGWKFGIAELAVVFLEAAILWCTFHRLGFTRRRMLAGSFVANAASFALTFVVP